MMDGLLTLLALALAGGTAYLGYIVTEVNPTVGWVIFLIGAGIFVFICAALVSQSHDDYWNP